MIGLDWQGLEDAILSGQWFQSYLFDYEEALLRPKQNNILSFLYKQTYENETWDLQILTLYGIDQSDTSLQVQLSYMIESNIKLWVGADVFSGPQPSLFGQFDQTDRITLGIEWGL